MQTLIDLFSVKGFIPHGYCLAWSPLLLWLHVVSDLLITSAYYSIPLILVYFTHKRKDLPFSWLVLMFAGFIVACGTTHLLSAITIWLPLYWLDGIVKGLTALISVATALLTVKIIPRALSLPSSTQLQAEIREKEQAEAAHQEAADRLAKIADQLPGVVFQFCLHADGHTSLPYASDRLRDLYRINPADVKDDAAQVFTVVHPEDLEAHLASIYTSAREQSPWRNEYRLKFADGSERWLFGNALPQREADGSVLWHGFVSDISEQKRVESELRDNEQKFRQLLQQVPLPLSIVNNSGEITYLNTRFEQLFGYNLKEIPTIEDWWQKAYPDPQYRHWVTARWSGAVERALRENTDIEPLEYNVCCKDGAIRTILFSGFCFTDNLLAVGVDLTERKNAELALLQSEIKFRTLYESTSDAVMLLDESGFFDCNSAALKLFGCQTTADFCRLHPADLSPPNQPGGGNSRALADRRIAEAIEQGSTDFEWLHKRIDSGEVFPAEVLLNALQLNGRPTIQATVRNIAERKKAEDIIQASAQYARSLIEASLDPLVTISAEGKITDVNAATEQATGINREQLIGSDFADYFTDPEKARSGYRQVFNHGSVTDYPLTIRHAEGGSVNVLYNASLYRDRDGKILGVFAAARDITERKKAEDIIQASAQYARSLIEASLDPLVTISAEGKITDVNAATEQATGINREQLIGSDFADYFTDPEKARSGYRQVFNHGSVTDYPLTIRHAEGGSVNVLYNASLYRDRDGKILGVFAAARDITERQNAERVSNLINSMIDISLDGFWIVDAAGNIVQVNQAYATISGYSKTELESMHISQLEAKEDCEQVKAHSDKVMTQGYDQFETHHRHKDGHLIDIDISAAYLPEFQQFCVFCRDISQRKLTEQALKQSVTKFRAIIEASPIPMALNDAQQNITFLNPAFIKTFGYTLNDIPTLSDWWPNAYPDPAYRQRVGHAWQAELKQAESERRPFTPMELSIFAKNGDLKTVMTSAATITGSFNDEHLIVLYDMTEHIQAEEALRISEAHFRNTFEHAPIGVVNVSLEGRFLAINQTFCDMLGYSREELLALSIMAVTQEQDKAAQNHLLQQLLTGEIKGFSLEKQYLCKDRSLVWGSLSVQLIRRPDGLPDYFIGTVEEITARKQMQAELTRSNSELEQFAYAVSHDMRQPLRMVASYLSLIETALAGQLDEDTQQCLNFALNGAKRMDAMITSLLEYSRTGRNPPTKMLCESKNALAEALAFLQPQLNESGGKVTVSGAWPALYASPDELTRLLQNLIGNALKYHEANLPPQVQVQATTTEATLRVEVRDHGIGIEPQQIDRLFKVFSRLQARSRFEGTGVGLALCRKIVEHHQGAIGVESAGEGHGCVFWFELPLGNNAQSPRLEKP